MITSLLDALTPNDVRHSVLIGLVAVLLLMNAYLIRMVRRMSRRSTLALDMAALHGKITDQSNLTAASNLETVKTEAMVSAAHVAEAATCAARRAAEMSAASKTMLEKVGADVAVVKEVVCENFPPKSDRQSPPGGLVT